jgi:hypothetical protein
MKCVILGLFIMLAGCGSTARDVCRRWQAEGDFYASIDACKRCIDTMGEAEKRVIAGCAMGYDASQLLGGMGR